MILANALKLPFGSDSAQCCVTSPPYWGLRDYGAPGQLGLEPTVEQYVANMVSVFREVHRVLRDDGTLWLNLGDCYISNGGTGRQGNRGDRANRSHTQADLGTRVARAGASLAAKQLVGVPWRVAFALQADGWWLRQDIVWHKLNPMPESVRDRPTRSHDYVFLLSKSAKYFYNATSIEEPASPSTHSRTRKDRSALGQKTLPTDTRNGMRPHGCGPKTTPAGQGVRYNDSFFASVIGIVPSRNARSVWSFPTQAYPGAHFATFPEELVRRCVLAGSREGDVVLDPFLGSGTTRRVAMANHRVGIGCDISMPYLRLAQRRTRDVQPVIPGLLAGAA